MGNLFKYLKTRWDLILWVFILILVAQQFLEVSKYLPHVTYKEWNYTVVSYTLNKSNEIFPVWIPSEYGTQEILPTPFNVELNISDVPQEMHFTGYIDVPENLNDAKFVIIADDCIERFSVNGKVVFNESSCGICPTCIRRDFDISKLCLHCNGKEFDLIGFLKPSLNRIDATVYKTYGVMRFKVFEVTHTIEKYNSGWTILLLILMGCLFTVIRKIDRNVLFLSIVNFVTIGYLIAIIKGYIYVGIPEFREEFILGTWNRPFPILVTYQISIFIIIFLLIMLILILNKKEKISEFTSLILMFFISLFFGLGIIDIFSIGLDFQPNTLDYTGKGYYSLANDKNIDNLLYTYNLKEDWPKKFSVIPHHYTHPPGTVIFFLVIKRTLIELVPIINLIPYQLPISILILMVFEYLAIFPIYYLSKLLYGKLVGIFSCIFYVFSISFNQFMPGTDGLVPFFILCSLYFFFRWINTRRYINIWISSMFFATGLFMNFLAIIVMIFIFLYVTLKQYRWSEIINVFLINIVVSGMFYLIVFWIFNYNIIVHLEGLLLNNPYLYNQLGMTYARSILTNILRFIPYAGIPTMLLLFRTLMRGYRYIQNDKYLLASLLTVLLLDISGMTRFEIERTWLLIIPLVSIIGAKELAKMSDGKDIFPILFFLLFIQILIFKVYVNP